MTFILTFLLILSILYMVKVCFGVVKWFLSDEVKEYTQTWHRTLLTILSLSFIITAIICGV